MIRVQTNTDKVQMKGVRKVTILVMNQMIMITTEELEKLHLIVVEKTMLLSCPRIIYQIYDDD